MVAEKKARSVKDKKAKLREIIEAIPDLDESALKEIGDAVMHNLWEKAKYGKGGGMREEL